MRKIVSLCKKYLPSKLWFFISNSYIHIVFDPLWVNKKKIFKERILKYYESKNSLNTEEQEAIAFLKENDLHVFPYEFSKNYDANQIEVVKDKDNDMFYCLLDNKRIYFKRAWSEFKIKRYFNFLLLEQDEQSAHRYLSNDFKIDAQSTLLDIGGAEGIFTLKYIEDIKKSYIFEPDDEWIEALEATFRPFKGKVEIVKKFVGDSNTQNEISIDKFCENLAVDFIKIDVDGAERKVLKGARNTISVKNGTKVAICTYHFQEDAEEFKDYFSDLGFKSHFSKGYMLFIFDRLFKEPFFRRGILRVYS